MKTVIELDTYMQSRNYSYIRSQFHNNGDEYIREYMHKISIFIPEKTSTETKIKIIKNTTKTIQLQS